MSHADFVHLRIHSAFSLSEGAIKIPGLVELCREHAMPAVAITDTGNLFGAMQFSEACSGAGIQPIIGCLLPLARADQPSAMGRALAPDGLPVLAQNETGYGNLVKLVTKAFLEPEPGEAPHVTWADLDTYSEGLIALTGGPGGPVGRLLGDGQTSAAEATLRRARGDVSRAALYRAHAPRIGRGETHRAGVDRHGVRARFAAGRDQRRVLHRRVHVRGPRSAAVHRRTA